MGKNKNPYSIFLGRLKIRNHLEKPGVSGGKY
jgi:hypothetical protein